MVADKDMREKAPLSENATKIISHKKIIKQMTNPSDSKTDFSGVLSSMCENNFKLSKKMAKFHLKACN